MNSRFTIDGSDALEMELGRICARLSGRIQSAVPEEKLEGIVLGGGYGRGQGGVLKVGGEDRPYNDLECYVFLRGSRLLNQQRYGPVLHETTRAQSTEALHTEVKIDSLARLRRSPVSMFTYDLLAGHKILVGAGSLFSGCEHHLDPGRIPMREATRLLFNRCSGLLLAKSLFGRTALTESERDFVNRNLAKAQLALGDSVLTAFGQYHCDCLERGRRLQRLDLKETPPLLASIRAHHLQGVAFKLHPRCSDVGLEDFERRHRELQDLALQIWLWLENRRLSCSFTSPLDYALSPVPKCPETSSWRNYLLNLRTFGLRAGFDPSSRRYPRERLFNAMALLLWKNEWVTEPALTRHVQRQLHSNATDWRGLVAAFNQVWPNYG